MQSILTLRSFRAPFERDGVSRFDHIHKMPEDKSTLPGSYVNRF